MPNQEVEMTWSGSNKKWFLSKGYEFTGFGDKFSVKADDLMPTSKTKVQAQCDYCGDIITKSFGHYVYETKDGGKCACSRSKCKSKKIKDLHHSGIANKQMNKFYDKCKSTGVIPISTVDDYENANSIVEYECKIHGRQSVRYSNFMYSDCACPKCSLEKFWEKQRYSNEEVKEIIESKNNNKWLNPGSYVDARISNLEILCGCCSKPYTCSLESYMNHSGKCKHCALIEETDKLRKTPEEVKKIIESQNNNKLLNPEDYVNMSTVNLKVKCGCGNVYITSLCNYLTKTDGKCVKCNYSSLGEHAISVFLDSNMIKYTTQERFDGSCRDDKPLPFDFYLPDYNLCIEFDGLHHYEPTWGEDAFLKTLLHDGMKNNYCKWNGIDLLRIPYWDYQNINNILTKYLDIQHEQNFDKIRYIPRSERMKNKEINIA